MSFSEIGIILLEIQKVPCLEFEKKSPALEFKENSLKWISTNLSEFGSFFSRNLEDFSLRNKAIFLQGFKQLFSQKYEKKLRL